VGKNNISLKVIDSGHIIPLSGQQEYTLGRVSGEQPILPDIDLSPFKGYEAGVSRLHATIRVDQEAIWVTDLGSVNGTLVNGAEIGAQIAIPLDHGDILTLGNLKLQFFIG
jgi:pSer/pThr/pTyr-binding forkhead associated (FHA) protein